MKTYVTKLKSFVILFFSPILLLPLIILIPDKVSCVSGQPGGTRVPSTITGTEPEKAENGTHGFPRGDKLPWGVCSDARGTRWGVCPAKTLRDAETLR